jgi:hypothetical protein
MNIRWGNIFGLMLIIFGIYLFIKMRPFLGNAIEDLNSGYYHHGDPVFRIAVLCILCITLIGALKILSGRKR